MLRCAFALLLSGCVGDIVELTPGAKNDLAQAANPDQAPPAGDGGNNADQAQATIHFDPTIQMDIDTLGCSASSCHGGTQIPVLKQMPATTADKMANYNNFKADAMNGAMSAVLTKNLAGDGVNHTGGKNFASTSDPVYQRWLAWIKQGNPQ